MAIKNLLYVLFVLGLLLACSSEDTSSNISDDTAMGETPSGNDSGSNQGNGNTDTDSGTDEPQNPIFLETLKVLFVGNSLTYNNDLPSLVKQEAAQKRINLQTDMQALPNYALIDHWNDGNVQQLIRDNGYDFVIVQQGPSSQAYGREVLIEYGGKFKTLCEENGSELVFFMVWPSRTYYNTFDGVIKNHKDAASINKALLAPVGEVWKQYFDDTNDFSYYGPDNFHPSYKGSQVAAKIIAETIF